MNKINNQLSALKERYIVEKERLKRVRDSYKTKKDQEYFQGHIDALQGFISDIEGILDQEEKESKIVIEEERIITPDQMKPHQFGYF